MTSGFGLGFIGLRFGDLGLSTSTSKLDIYDMNQILLYLAPTLQAS